MNVKKDDNVLVITGKYAGKQGKVISTSPKKGTIKVAGVNMQKRAQKARRANEVSKIAEKEGPIDVSNVMLVCDACGKAIRVKYGVVDGKKARVCPKCGAALDKAYGAKNAKSTAKEAPKKRVRKRAAKAEKAAEDKAE